MNDEDWMKEALELAYQASKQDEVPVGAIVVLDDEIIGKGFNQPISSNDPSAHAEIVALRDAAQQQRNYRLTGSKLYVTLEPCPMCAGAMLHARVKNLIYGAKDPKTGAIDSKISLLNQTWNHTIETHQGVLAKDCSKLLIDFFKKRR